MGDAQIERVQVSQSVLQTRPTAAARAVLRPAIKSFVQPYPDALFTFFDGTGWRIETVEALSARLIRNPSYRELNENGYAHPVTVLSIVVEAFHIGEGSIGTADAQRILNRFHQLLQDHDLVILENAQDVADRVSATARESQAGRRGLWGRT
jgi:hypothetical protein